MDKGDKDTEVCDEKREESSELHHDASKRKGRKRVAKRKVVRRPKRRGTYKPKSIGVGDTDVAECIFSDDEMRAEFVECHVPDDVDDRQSTSMAETVKSEQSIDVLDLELISPQSDSSSSSAWETTSKSDSVSSSRPPSGLERPLEIASGSRPSSSLSARPSLSDSRPSSALSFVLESGEEMEEDDSQSIVVSPADAPSLSYVCDDLQSLTTGSPSIECIEKGLAYFRSILPKYWIPIADTFNFHLLFLSQNSPKAVQREICVSYLGKCTVLVHCVPIPFITEIACSPPWVSIKLDESSVEKFCDNALAVVKKVMQYDVCVGANHVDTRDIWGNVPGTFIDTNPYRESKYTETCRSLQCCWLVEIGKAKRCSTCRVVIKKLMKRKESVGSASADRSTPNIFLTPQQAMAKLKQQHEDIRKKDKQIAYLTQRIQHLLQKEGVDIDEDLNRDLSHVLSQNPNMSEVQKMFFQEQLKCLGKADPRSHRWHPSMIRLALHLKMVSSSAYEALRDSGAIKLPSSRTLFDYSHAITAKEGINDGLIKLVYKRISELKKPCQKYHALLCDEVHCSQNLVYRQSDGHLVGYTHLDDVEKELQEFEKFIAGSDKTSNPVLASKILAFMVKGLASDVKCVVASYPVNQLTKDMLYARSWQVISALEKQQIKILAFVCDGSSVNRAFIAMHTPVTKLKSGVVFDTINFCSPERRLLYFISDVCHLLKTIRNCFYNSGEDEKKTRRLLFNGQFILWKFIIRLYLTFKNDNFRKSYKLNSQNVFPNAYSCMRVRYAAEVLSKTVADDLASQEWPNTEETVRFILHCNKFFDCLNGAFSTQHKRTLNEDLAPYCDANDSRFNWLQGFLEYLDTWKQQSEALPILPQEKAKTMLSRQTLDGIEMSIHGFTGATKFLLDPVKGGADFVMARAFSQDPLEQNFSRLRAGQGGSRNPNISQVLVKQVSLGIQRDLGVRVRKGNVKDEGHQGMQLSDEPLPKRRRK